MPRPGRMTVVGRPARLGRAVRRCRTSPSSRSTSASRTRSTPSRTRRNTSRSPSRWSPPRCSCCWRWSLRRTLRPVTDRRGPRLWRSAARALARLACRAGARSRSGSPACSAPRRCRSSRSRRSRTWSTRRPFAAPLAYTGLGLLLLLDRMVDAADLDWARWVVLLALGGFVGNFVLTLADHAQNGFFHPSEWIGVVAGAVAGGFLPRRGGRPRQPLRCWRP